MSLQLDISTRRLANDDIEPAEQRAEPRADGRAHYMALHSNFGRVEMAEPLADHPTNNTLGAGAATLDPLIMYQPLASLVNGKVPADAASIPFRRSAGTGSKPVPDRTRVFAPRRALCVSTKRQ